LEKVELESGFASRGGNNYLITLVSHSGMTALSITKGLLFVVYDEYVRVAKDRGGGVAI